MTTAVIPIESGGCLYARSEAFEQKPDCYPAAGEERAPVYPSDYLKTERKSWH